MESGWCPCFSIHFPRLHSLLSYTAISGLVMLATTKRHVHPSSLTRPRIMGIMRRIWGLHTCLVVSLFIVILLVLYANVMCADIWLIVSKPMKIGFSHEFYDEYHKVHPRSSPYYDERQKLYELYHHLNVRSYFPISSPPACNGMRLIDVTH